MFEGRGSGSVGGYVEAGQEATRFISDSLAAVGRTFGDVDSVLDFGCGHGRVTRWLAPAVSAGAVTVCDLDREAIEFCASEFGTRALLSSLDINEVALEKYDVIWLGSVLTHVSGPTASSLLQVLVSHLQQRGIIAFSTRGEPSAEWEREACSAAGLRPASIPEMMSRDGMAYVAYTHYKSDYGLAWHSPEWMIRTMANCSDHLQKVRYDARRWGGFQDLWAFVLEA
jgi:SAM-dependent methyltransferase